jgi:T4 RnlA family RNA ligase
MKLKIQEFISNHSNWQELLSNAPYNLKISYKNGLYCFKYNQINSNFNNPIVCEARGLILDSKTFEVVCCPFFKFFNIDEPHAAKIDWENGISVSEKIDGSLIKLYYWNDKWNVATNSGIDAADSNLSNNIIYKNFYELFMAALPSTFSFDNLNKAYTYVFELVSPFNKVVISYNKPKLYLLMVRDNKTLKEINYNFSDIEKPEIYFVRTEEDCRRLIQRLNDSNILTEGIVIKDSHNNRVKLKTAKYFDLHYMVNNHIMTLDRLIPIVRRNEVDELLSYFPEYTEIVCEIQKNIGFMWDLLVDIVALPQILKDRGLSRKDFALHFRNYEFKYLAFMVYDGKLGDLEEYLKRLSDKDFIKLYKKLFC